MLFPFIKKRTDSEASCRLFNFGSMGIIRPVLTCFGEFRRHVDGLIPDKCDVTSEALIPSCFCFILIINEIATS